MIRLVLGSARVPAAMLLMVSGDYLDVLQGNSQNTLSDDTGNTVSQLLRTTLLRTTKDKHICIDSVLYCCIHCESA